jgi:pantetheine-phosphate adenylyltransferase
MKAVYPGCFDPVTKGHIDVIKRASRICDHVVVLISSSFEKPSFFTIEERINLLKDAVKDIKNVSVDSWDGLTVSYLKDNNTNIIIRGVRSTMDFRQEQTLANINLEIDSNVETLLFCCRPEFRDVSSRTIKEMAHFGAPFEKYVTPYTADFIHSKISEKNKTKNK